MIVGQNGPHLAKTAHDHGRHPKCRNVKLRHNGFPRHRGPLPRCERGSGPRIMPCRRAVRRAAALSCRAAARTAGTGRSAGHRRHRRTAASIISRRAELASWSPLASSGTEAISPGARLRLGECPHGSPEGAHQLCPPSDHRGDDRVVIASAPRPAVRAAAAGTPSCWPAPLADKRPRRSEQTPWRRLVRTSRNRLGRFRGNVRSAGDPHRRHL